MKRRKFFIILGVVILAGTVFLVSSISSNSSSKSNQKASDKAQTAVVVDSKKSNAQVIQTYINVTGRLQPEDKIDIYAEVTGVLQNTGKPFKVGVPYRQGQVLVRINNDEALQNLNAQKNSFINSLAQVVPDLKID